MVPETLRSPLASVLQFVRATQDRRGRFQEWKAERPFWGAVFLILAGLVLSAIPFTALGSFAFTGSTGELIGLIGLFFSFFVFLSGVAALTQPQLSTLAGMIGIIMSILSIVGGTLGGMFVGTFLGMIGGSLCIAWIEETPDDVDRRPEPPEASEAEPAAAPEDIEAVDDRLDDPDDGDD